MKYVARITIIMRFNLPKIKLDSKIRTFNFIENCDINVDKYVLKIYIIILGFNFKDFCQFSWYFFFITCSGSSFISIIDFSINFWIPTNSFEDSGLVTNVAKGSGSLLLYCP